MTVRFNSSIPQAIQQFQANEIRALEAVGVFVVGETQGRAPVDTGRLRGSYDHRTNRAEKSVAIGTNVDYGPYVEMGTRRMREQPHLRPAAENNVHRINQLIAIQLRQGMT